MEQDSYVPIPSSGIDNVMPFTPKAGNAISDASRVSRNKSPDPQQTDSGYSPISRQPLSRQSSPVQLFEIIQRTNGSWFPPCPSSSQQETQTSPQQSRAPTPPSVDVVLRANEPRDDRFSMRFITAFYYGAIAIQLFLLVCVFYVAVWYVMCLCRGGKSSDVFASLVCCTMLACYPAARSLGRIMGECHCLRWCFSQQTIAWMRKPHLLVVGGIALLGYGAVVNRALSAAPCSGVLRAHAVATQYVVFCVPIVSEIVERWMMPQPAPQADDHRNA